MRNVSLLVIVTAIVSACADTTAPALDKPFQAPAIEQGASEPRLLDLKLFGTITSTSFVDASGRVKGTQTVIGASPSDAPVGMPRDTMLQLMLGSDPVGGRIVLPAVPVEVLYFGALPLLVHKRSDENGFTAGTPPLMMFAWPSGAPAPTRELSQAEEAQLDVSVAEKPTETEPGSFAGVLDFVADEWQRTWDIDGHATLARTGSRVRIRAQLQLRWETRTSRIPTGP